MGISIKPRPKDKNIGKDAKKAKKKYDKENRYETGPYKEDPTEEKHRLLKDGKRDEKAGGGEVGMAALLATIAKLASKNKKRTKKAGGGKMGKRVKAMGGKKVGTGKRVKAMKGKRVKAMGGTTMKGKRVKARGGMTMKGMKKK
tara:strand:+ start:49 stop:480 length:432 start_codon:yes stop_codon:yes gene_type:complete